jgi:hypothetical protein
VSRTSCGRANAGNKANAQAEQQKPETERWPQDPVERNEARLSGNQIRASCTELAARKIKALSRARPDELERLGEASSDSERKTDLDAPAHAKGERGLWLSYHRKENNGKNGKIRTDQRTVIERHEAEAG